MKSNVLDPGRPSEVLLRDLFAAHDDGARADALAAVTKRAGEVIDRVLAAQTASVRREAADMRSAVLLRLLLRLRRPEAGEPIENFELFVVATTHNAINDHLRRLFPARARLKNRLRYLLTHVDAFALWEGDRGLLAGVREWRGNAQSSARTLAPDDLPREAFDRRDDRAALAAVFACAGGAMPLDDLVDLLAAVWGVTEDRSGEVPKQDELDAESSVVQRDELAALWREVLLLPPAQRTALLLHLRDADGGNALALVVLLDVAAFDEVAAAAGIAPERLAEIWSRLPLDDNTIAALLGVTRQQVINLRSAARRRLLRRIEARDKAAGIISRGSRPSS